MPGPSLTLSVEFFPPKTDKGEENLFSEIEIIKRLNPAFCSVTYGAGGSTREKTVDLVEPNPSTTAAWKSCAT